MQYLVSVIAQGNELASPNEMANIRAFNQRLQAQGHWVFGNGLAEPSAATVVDARAEQPIFSDGPFLESKEFLAGFWVLEAPDLDVALKLATEGSKVCNRKVELRPFRTLEQ